MGEADSRIRIFIFGRGFGASCFQSSLPKNQIQPAKFITQFIFLAASHNIFTFALLVFNPDSQSLYLISLKRRRSWVVIGVIAVPCIMLASVIKYAALDVNPRIFAGVIFLLAVLKARHSPGQVFGISKLFLVNEKNGGH